MRVIYREPLTRVDFNFLLLRRGCAQSDEIIEAGNLFFNFHYSGLIITEIYIYILKIASRVIGEICSRIHGRYREGEMRKDPSFRGPFVNHRTGNHPLTRVANGNKRPMQRMDCERRNEIRLYSSIVYQITRVELFQISRPRRGRY